MFNENIDISEWDFLIKFWGPVLEKWFIDTGLRLKWGDTLLTMKDVSNDNEFKIDLKVINDKTVQRYNEESEVTVAEAAKNDPGLYISNEASHVQLDYSLQRFPIYLQTVFQLLCFRNEAIRTSNVHDNIKSISASKRTSVKGYKYNKGSKTAPIDLSRLSWTQGNWFPPRRKDSSLPSIPSKLVSQ